MVLLQTRCLGPFYIQLKLQFYKYFQINKATASGKYALRPLPPEILCNATHLLKMHAYLVAKFLEKLLPIQIESLKAKLCGE